jgi:signal transduction histidine kinase
MRSAVSAVRMPPPETIDLAVVAVVGFLTTADAAWNEAGTRQADWLTFALVVVSVLPLMVRRRFPVTVSLVCGAALTGWYVLGHHGELLNLPTMVGLYTVTVQGNRRRTLAVGVVASAWSGILGFTDDSPYGAPGGSPVLEMIWPWVPLLLGEVVRGRRELLDEYAARATRAEAEREREARRRVDEERLRIARELHDIVAHTVAAMNVQAGLAADAFDRQPDVARGALKQVRESGREALGELHATVALLRDGRTTSTTPAPTLDRLGDLVDRTATAGVDVTLHRDTGDRPLPAVVELTVYRIVQEALTNIIRHTNARHAAVSVARDGDVLAVEITDDGTVDAAGSSPGATGGFGLVGMEERVSAVGGQIEHGPQLGGGFAVRAMLPLEGTHA